jgi:SAM-dependent methyltransferase
MRKLVLWGHNVQEYKEMFDLSEQDLSGRILEFGCGPSAINASLTGTAKEVVSCDDMFAMDKQELRGHVDQVFDSMLAQVKKYEGLFQWDDYGNLDGFVHYRSQGIEKFFDDYEQGLEQKRYIHSDGLVLPYDDFHFDIALSSHYLFANIEGQDVEFHIQAIRELSRVAKEVRIFPLIDRDDHVSQFLGPVMLGLQQDNLGLEVRQVPYHLQAKGNAMLRVWAHECVVE